MSFDLPISLYVHEHLSGPVLDRLFIFITGLGNWGIFWLIFTLGLLVFKKTRWIGIVCVIALICDFLLVELIKYVVARPRPFQAYNLSILIEPPSGTSFPSAHSSISFSVATVYFLMGKSKPNSILRWFILTLAVLIAYSRLYLFVHYLSDIVVGALIGIAVGILAVYLMNRWFADRFVRDSKKF